MAIEIEYTNDKTQAIEKMKGSDGRQNSSSRADPRIYYNSRDRGQTYSIGFDFQDAAPGEYGAYLQNTSSSTLVINSIEVSTAQAARIKLWFVTGDAASGTIVTPVNQNKTSPNAATTTAVAREGGSSASGITGLTQDGIIRYRYVRADDSIVFMLNNTVRLGQNDAIAVQYFEGTDGDMSGAFVGFFE